MWVHRVVGLAIFVLTIALSLVGMRMRNWELGGDAHYVLGLIIFFSILLLVLGGVMTRSRMNRLKWKTHVILKFKLFHKVKAYYLSKN